MSCYHDEVFHDDDHVVRPLTKILDDAAGSHRKLDPAEGLQDAQLDNGARLHIVHRDVGRDGHLLVNIRKFTGVPFRSLDDLVERDMLEPPAAEFLRHPPDPLGAGRAGDDPASVSSLTQVGGGPAERPVALTSARPAARTWFLTDPSFLQLVLVAVVAQGAFLGGYLLHTGIRPALGRQNTAPVIPGQPRSPHLSTSLRWGRWNSRPPDRHAEDETSSLPAEQQPGRELRSSRVASS
jgi:hypothetical protein